METEPSPDPETSPRHRLDDGEPAPVYDEAGHELDDADSPIHIDVDEQIPTGICRYCP